MQSVRIPVQLGGALTGRFTAGRQAGWATMPEARVESHSGNTGKLHKNNVDTLSRPTGGSATECCGYYTVETGAVGAMRARQMATRRRAGGGLGRERLLWSAIVRDREGWDGHWRGRGAGRSGLRGAHGPPLVVCAARAAMTSTSGAFRTKYTHAPRFGNCESNRSTRSPKGVGTPPGTAKPTRCTSHAVAPRGTGKEVFGGR